MDTTSWPGTWRQRQVPPCRPGCCSSVLGITATGSPALCPRLYAIRPWTPVPSLFGGHGTDRMLSQGLESTVYSSGGFPAETVTSLNRLSNPFSYLHILIPLILTLNNNTRPQTQMKFSSNILIVCL